MQLELRSREWPFSSRAVASLSQISLLALTLALAGCGSDDEPSSGNVLITDENNYTSTSNLTIPTVETAAATDLDICWDGVDQDIQCHDVDAKADIDNVGLLRFLHLTEKDVEGKLTAGQVSQSEITGYVEYQTKNASTCTTLSAMNFFGTVIKVDEEYLETDDRIYMLLFSKGTTPGVGARTMTFIKPTATSTNTTVTAPTGCGMLDFSADLESATPLKVATKGPWKVDWHGAKHDSQGNAIAYQNIDSVMVGFFAGMTVAELQTKLMDLELLATDIWEVRLKGARNADLASALHRETGARFPGFDRTDGVWALGLMCSTCQNPAPVVLTVLDPEGS